MKVQELKKEFQIVLDEINKKFVQDIQNTLDLTTTNLQRKMAALAEKLAPLCQSEENPDSNS